MLYIIYEKIYSDEDQLKPTNNRARQL